MFELNEVAVFRFSMFLFTALAKICPIEGWWGGGYHRFDRDRVVTALLLNLERDDEDVSTT